MKNAEFLEWLIQLSSDPGGLVSDPFMGIGSTALAALRTGRSFVGSEIEKTYYQSAQQRISREYSAKIKEEKWHQETG
jgi:site-specific DNA-methyltransferase (adenine-specific)